MMLYNIVSFGYSTNILKCSWRGRNRRDRRRRLARTAPRVLRCASPYHAAAGALCALGVRFGAGRTSQARESLQRARVALIAPGGLAILVFRAVAVLAHVVQQAAEVKVGIG